MIVVVEEKMRETCGDATSPNGIGTNGRDECYGRVGKRKGTKNRTS